MPNVTDIGGGAFSGCSNLKNIDLSNVTTIGGSAFEYCRSLTEIDLPSIENIDQWAFHSKFLRSSSL